MPLTPGTHLGPYEVIEPIGAGGMGEVYKARDTRLRRDVAVKILQQVATDGAAWERFQREARAASALSHPNICTVFDVGEADGQPYLVMELLDGVTLKARIGEQPLETAVAVAIATQIVDALEAAHQKGIIHRDIKPANVMLIGRGHVKVLDFGLAKQTAVGEDQETLTLESLSAVGAIMGTPHYIAPEILQGQKADARSDLWAFGVVLYQMLSGRLPFNGGTMFELSSSVLKESTPPLPETVPAHLRAIVDRCLKKRPEDRHQSATELRAALNTSAPAAAPVASKRTWVWGVGVAAALLAAALFWWYRPAPSTGYVPSSNPEANDLFARAMALQHLQNDVPNAMNILQRAIDLDPNFAEAHRYHAFDYITMLLNGFTNDVAVLDKADEELRLVARLTPNLESLPSAQTALYFTKGQREYIPLQRLEEVLRDNPGQLETAVWRMILHTYAEENAAAKALAQSMLDRESTFGPPRFLRGELLRTEGDTAGAIRDQKAVLEVAPRNLIALRSLALAYMDGGEIAKARATLEEQRFVFANNFMWRQTWALLLAVEGKTQEAKAAMDPETLKFSAAHFQSALQTAEYFAVLGDSASAIQWIRLAVGFGDERVDWFRRNLRLASLQKDPEFLRIVENIEARRKK